MVAAFHATYYIRTRTPFDASEIHTWVVGAFGVLWTGVPLFFVISGYCITAAVDNLRRRPNVSVVDYFSRRIKRIFPPYWCVLLVTLIITLVLESWLASGLLWNAFLPFPDPGTYSLPDWAHNLTLTAPMVGEPLFVGVAWTLAYEEQFYAVVGLCLLCTRRRLCAALTLVTVLVVAMMHLAPVLGFGLGKFFFNGFWLAFAAGALVYGQTNYGTRRSGMMTVLLLMAGTVHGLALARPAGIVDLARQMIHPGMTYIPSTIFVASLFAFLLLVLKPYDRSLSESRWLRPLMWAGTMCYSIYLVHSIPVELISHGFDRGGVTNPWVVLGLVVPLCLAASIAAGWVFFVLVERRFLNSRPERKVAPAHPAPAAEGEAAMASASIAILSARTDAELTSN